MYLSKRAPFPLEVWVGAWLLGLLLTVPLQSAPALLNIAAGLAVAFEGYRFFRRVHSPSVPRWLWWALALFLAGCVAHVLWPALSLPPPERATRLDDSFHAFLSTVRGLLTARLAWFVLTAGRDVPDGAAARAAAGGAALIVGMALSALIGVCLWTPATAYLACGVDSIHTRIGGTSSNDMCYAGRIFPALWAAWLLVFAGRLAKERIPAVFIWLGAATLLGSLGIPLARRILHVRSESIGMVRMAVPHAWAWSLGAGVAAALAWIVFARGGAMTRRYMAWAALLLGFGNLLITGSRSWAGYFVAWFGLLLLVWVVKTWRRNAIPFRVMGRRLAVGCVAVLLFGTALLWANPRIRKTGFHSGREDIWHSALAMVRERPWLGHGYGNDFFQHHWRDYLPEDSGFRDMEVIFVEAHNFHLHVLVERGVIGFLLLHALWVSVLIAAWRTAAWPLWVMTLLLPVQDMFQFNMLFEREIWYWALPAMALGWACHRGRAAAQLPDAVATE